MLRNWSTTTSVPAGAEANSASSSASLLRTGALASTSPSRSIRQAQCDDLPTSRPSTAAGLVDGAFTVVSFRQSFDRMASPSALTLPAAAPARHFPISRRGRRVPRRQHPTGPLGGRDVRPCAGARSAARSGRASIVARDGPGLTISTVMDVPFLSVFGDTPCGFATDLFVCRRASVHSASS